MKEYAYLTGDYGVFKEKVDLLFLSDDLQKNKELRHNGHRNVVLLEEVVHSIFQSHAHGISFREWNSGYEIDSQMRSEGFNIALTVDEATGFIQGGNQKNCLTWMDKMGSSHNAGTLGVPATPRAGAPV